MIKKLVVVSYLGENMNGRRIQAYCDERWFLAYRGGGIVTGLVAKLQTTFPHLHIEAETTDTIGKIEYLLTTPDEILTGKIVFNGNLRNPVVSATIDYIGESESEKDALLKTIVWEISGILGYYQKFGKMW